MLDLESIVSSYGGESTDDIVRKTKSCLAGKEFTSLHSQKERAAGLVSARIMIQHDSLSPEYFLPFVTDSHGARRNIGLFVDTEFELPNGCDISSLYVRKVAIACEIPSSSTWGMFSLPKDYQQLYLLLYSNEVARVNSCYEVRGIIYTSDSEASPNNVNFPRLHVVELRPLLPELQNNILKVPLIQAGPAKNQLLDVFDSMKISPRNSLFLLTGLFSKTIHRQQGLLSNLLLGYQPLNVISSCPENLLNILTYSFPFISVFKMSDILKTNEGSVVKIDDECLERSPLQLPTGSIIVLIEDIDVVQSTGEKTCFTENITQLIANQDLTYKFGPHRSIWPVCHPVLILSEAPSFFLSEVPHMLTVHLNDVGSAPELDDRQMSLLRSSIIAAINLNPEISDSTADIIEHDIAPITGPEKLFQCLNIAKILSAARLNNSVDYSNIQDALEILS